jgi:hypothetical protein
MSRSVAWLARAAPVDLNDPVGSIVCKSTVAQWPILLRSLSGVEDGVSKDRGETQDRSASYSRTANEMRQ